MEQAQILKKAEEEKRKQSRTAKMSVSIRLRSASIDYIKNHSQRPDSIDLVDMKVVVFVGFQSLAEVDLMLVLFAVTNDEGGGWLGRLRGGV